MNCLECTCFSIQFAALVVSASTNVTSSVVHTQIRTEKIGLNAFLYDRSVSGIWPACSCGCKRQTAKHVLLFYPERAASREELRDYYSKMLAEQRAPRNGFKTPVQLGRDYPFRRNLLASSREYY